MKKPSIITYRKLGFYGIGVAAAISPIAIAASCGSSDETAPSAQSIDTSQVNLSGVSVSGTVTSPAVSLGGTFLPANTALRYKIGASDWLDEVAFKAYVIANASKLADADLGAVKSRLVSASEKFTLSTPKEVAASGKISRTTTTPTVTSVDTSSANLSAITVGGLTSAPVINLNGFAAPANTILLFQIASSSWLNESGIKAYIIANAASLTATQLSAVKAHLEPASAAYTLTSNREVTLTGSITKPPTTTSVDTSSANLSVITIGGTTAAPVINLNGFAAPANTLLRFQVGASLWLDQASLIAYITTNAATLTTPQFSALKARLEPVSAAYSLSSNREVTLAGSITKPAATPDVINRSTMELSLNSKTFFAIDAISTNTKPEVIATESIAKSYEFLYGDYPTVASAKAALNTEWKRGLPSVISFDKTKRHLWLRVTVKSLAELGANTAITSQNLQTFDGDNQYFDLTTASQVQKIKSDIAQLPELAAFTLDNLLVVGDLNQTVVNMADIVLPENTTIEFIVNNVTLKRSELPNYIKQNKTTLTATQLDNIVAKLIVSDSTQYALSTQKQSTLKYTRDATLTIDQWKAKYPQFVDKIVDGKLTVNAFFQQKLPEGFTLPSSITLISQGAFWEATLPPKFTIPFSVTQIDTNAFLNANIGIGFTPSPNIKLFSYFGQAILPAGFIISENSEQIGAFAFERTTLPKGIIIPPSVNNIWRWAFFQAVLPEGFKLPETVKILEEGSFRDATVPFDFSVPDSLKSQAAAAFQGAKYPDGTPFTP